MAFALESLRKRLFHHIFLLFFVNSDPKLSQTQTLISTLKKELKNAHKNIPNFHLTL